MEQAIRGASHLMGKPKLPGDKSIAHRAAIFSAISEGACEIVHFPDARDPQSTLRCLEHLGIQIESADRAVIVHGRGLRGLSEPERPIDCGNSGTTMRLLAGLLAGQPFSSVLVGDESLSARPMERVAEPLRKMGAEIALDGGRPPIRIRGAKKPLKPVDHRLAIPSAQVKSAILLAGLFADGETTVVETVRSRDHTERMLRLETLTIGSEHSISISGGRAIPAQTWAVPADFSAAAFFLVAAPITPNADVWLKGVGLNPTRAAALDVLRAMGANITVSNERFFGGEPIADLRARSSQLTSVTVEGPIIPRLIDEIPVLAVAAAMASGTTIFRDAEELRVKETDRIAATVTNLRRLGADVTEHEDGFSVTGGHRLTGAEVQSFGDHRIAMAMGVAALVADGRTVISEADCADVSFPDYWRMLRSMAGQ